MLLIEQYVCFFLFCFFLFGYVDQQCLVQIRAFDSLAPSSMLQWQPQVSLVQFPSHLKVSPSLHNTGKQQRHTLDIWPLSRVF